MVFRNPQANTAASMASASKAIQSVYTAEYETKSRTFAADTAELAQVEHALKPAGENDLLKGETDPTLKPFVNLQSESNKIQIIEDTSKKKVDYLPQADYDKMPLDSLNEKDNFGNAPLHLAILRGDSEYSELLISKGADINLKNQTDLTPLHLAVFLNQKETVNNLIVKGAEINLQGYYGYNALHIATELGYTEVAGILLRAGAAANIRTAQKLSPNIIARIQDNPEMISLIKSRGKSAQNSFSKNYISLTVKDVSAYPEIDFQLPYDPELVRKRNVNRLIQWISVPVFVASAAGAVYLRSEANTFFKNYKVAENADDALNYYNKTKRYDTYALISVTISAGSVYSFIHSAIRKNSITKKMRKSF